MADDSAYSWLNDYAEKQFAESLEQRKGLDDKAAAIITHLASGAGLATLGSIIAISASKVDAAIVAWMLPAFLAAYASIACALLARYIGGFWGLPPLSQAKSHAEHYETEAAAKRALVDVWIKVLEQNEPTLDRKARLVNWSMSLFLLSIFLLIVPFMVSIARSSPTLRSEPPPVPASSTPASSR